MVANFTEELQAIHGMRQTLFLIPHEWLTSFALPLWIALCILGLIVQVRRFGWKSQGFGMAGVFVVGLIVIRVVLPFIEIDATDPADPTQVIRGLPIRGFGLMFLLATVAGVALATRRARQMGIDPEEILGLAFGMIIAGLVGARIYYVVQYWDQFSNAPNFTSKLLAVVNTTQGGIVVYGALIGSLLAAVLTCWHRRLPLLAIADIIMPAMLIGLSLGRIGCFMNGCCYGGVCDWPIAVQFPDRPAYSGYDFTPPYDHQLSTGKLIGLTTRSLAGDEDWREVIEVEPGSLAEQADIVVGDQIRRNLNAQEYQLDIRSASSTKSRPFALPFLDLPRHSAAVHPTQLYSSINAFLLCLFLWFYYPFRYGDGEVFGIGLVLYAIARFLLELIRDDEAGQFNTDLTTAQWTSLIMLAIGMGLIAWTRLRPPSRALPPSSLSLSDGSVAAKG